MMTHLTVSKLNCVPTNKFINQLINQAMDKQYYDNSSHCHQNNYIINRPTNQSLQKIE